MKKHRWTAISVLLAAAFLAVVFTGCVSTGGNFVVKDCVSKCKVGDISATYGYFDGNKFYRFKLEEGETVTIGITTEDGTLNMVVADSDENVIIAEYCLLTGSRDFTAEKDDTYTVSFTAAEHKGGYEITW
jgi:hypothetical protein